jgi:hypothetical protein
MGPAELELLDKATLVEMDILLAPAMRAAVAVVRRRLELMFQAGRAAMAPLAALAPHGLMELLTQAAAVAEMATLGPGLVVAEGLVVAVQAVAWMVADLLLEQQIQAAAAVGQALACRGLRAVPAW